MRILAIDPGPEQSALVVTDGEALLFHAKLPNDSVLAELSDAPLISACVIEMVASYGMAVGKETFETVFWIGRFAERWHSERREQAHRLTRKDIKLHHCETTRANDSNIRFRIIDRFGGKARAIGTKKAPGPLYGVKGDEWAALALALTFIDTQARELANADLAEPHRLDGAKVVHRTGRVEDGRIILDADRIEPFEPLPSKEEG